MGCVALISCKPEEVEPVNHDTLGFEINDSITVHFSDQRWTTLRYNARTERDSIASLDWIYVDARYPEGNFPFIRMKFLRGEGSHSASMTIHDIGLGYTIPGALSGDMQCGHVFYFERGEVHSPDGTVTSDWWPLNITMEVLNYDDSLKTATAYIHGTLFDYRSWVNREVVNVEDCDTVNFTITFGDLPVGGN